MSCKALESHRRVSKAHAFRSRHRNISLLPTYTRAVRPMTCINLISLIKLVQYKRALLNHTCLLNDN